MAVKLKVSSNGQVSIPADVRRRWNVTEVLVTDLGDRLVVTPVPTRGSLRGKYKDALPVTERLRADERRQRGRP
jgi:AbrB family looped-hinge helix DNA binding protein